MILSTSLKRGCAVLALLTAALLVTGCGRSGSDGRYAIEGNVTLDGHPLPEGTIDFIPYNDKDVKLPRAHGVIKDGHYAISSSDGPVEGKQKVYISYKKKTGKQVMSNDPPNMVDEVIEVVPKIYNENTTLTADIKAEANKQDFTLNTPAKEESGHGGKKKKNDNN